MSQLISKIKRVLMNIIFAIIVYILQFLFLLNIDNISFFTHLNQW
jgi:hypothetical protein